MHHSYRLIGLAVVAAMSLAACTKKQGETASTVDGGAENKNSSGEVIEIGTAAPLTGGISHLGKDIQNGARLALGTNRGG
jgi:branched-chain amino acid transport system substrate-binding protein